MALSLGRFSPKPPLASHSSACAMPQRGRVGPGSRPCYGSASLQWTVSRSQNASSNGPRCVRDVSTIPPLLQFSAVFSVFWNPFLLSHLVISVWLQTLVLTLTQKFVSQLPIPHLRPFFLLLLGRKIQTQTQPHPIVVTLFIDPLILNDDLTA